MELNFCRRCGSPLSLIKMPAYKCANGHYIFAAPVPTVGIFFVNPQGEVLLSERGIEPRKGMLDSFGGFVDGEESLEQAAIRELREELSLEPSDYNQLNYLTSAIGHYPYGGEVVPILSSFFWTELKPGVELKPQDDVAAIHSIPLRKVDLSLLHDDDIRAGITALQAVFHVK